ncbi:ABC transporter ATP-binding protein, partial [Mycobacterium sp. ITM-2017-0098]
MLSQVLGFVRAWVDAQVDWKLLAEIRQRVHDHLQSLSLDFFTGARSGALMQRVQVEAGGVQKLLTDCIIPPGIDAIVLVIAL